MILTLLSSLVAALFFFRHSRALSFSVIFGRHTACVTRRSLLTNNPSFFFKKNVQGSSTFFNFEDRLTEAFCLGAMTL